MTRTNPVKWLWPTRLVRTVGRVLAGAAVLAGTSAVVVARNACAQFSPLSHSAQRYVIDATLEPGTHTIRGTERIHFRNDSVVPVSALYFHLYMNAFRTDTTVFMLESGGQLRGDASNGHGSIDVDAIRIAGGPDLRPSMHTDLVKGDQTQMRVDLPTPLEPGVSIDLSVAFHTKLPPVFARAGYFEQFNMVAQWFPKLARLEPDGHWATFPYHGFAEFYADYAHYELTTHTPRGWKVAACGRLVGEHEDSHSVTRTFVADDVHDVAWATAPWLVESSEHVGAVDVHIFAPPGYESNVARHREVLSRVLPRYELLFGTYPYASLTVVVPPFGAGGAAGMEYPTMISSGGTWLDIPAVPPASVDEVAVHELAHEWFYGLVGSNEVEWPMLDEGITQWVTLDAMRALHGEDTSYVETPDLTVSGFEATRAFAVRAEPEPPPPGLPAYGYTLGRDYGAAVYGRTAVVLETVRRTYGARRFDHALGRYARAQRFRHPVPDDLFAAFDAVYGAGFASRVLAPALLEGDRASFRVSSLSCRREGQRWVTEVEARRDGRLELDTWLALRDERGEIARILFPHTTSTLRATHVSDTEVVEARVDPDRADLLDRWVLDDVQRTPHAPPRPPRAPLARILFAMQTLLSMVGP